MARFLHEAIGAFAPVHNAFLAHADQFNQEKRQELVEVVRKFEDEGRVSMLITGYFASGMAVRSSKLDSNLFYEWTKNDQFADALARQVRQEFPDLKVRFFEAFRVEDALNIIRSLAQGATVESSEAYEAGIKWLADFYTVLAIGGLFIGRDLYATKSEIEMVASQVPDLHNKVLNPAYERLKSAKKRFYEQHKRMHFRRLNTNLRQEGKSEAEIQKIDREIGLVIGQFMKRSY